MLGLTLASLRARPLRALLTAFSIVLGVAMISGTFVVTGQINRAFSEIFDGVKRLRVVGIYTIGTTASLGGALVSSIPLASAQHWYSLDGKFTQVNVQAAPGVSKSTLRDRIRQRLGSGYKVQTGSEKAKADSKGIADVINGFLGPALLAFGGVAVLVGAFIIFNMFSITVAQRIREIAMLRTLGASRRQILTSVLVEALATGLVGTIIGIFAGLLIALGINALFDAVGFGLPSTSPALATSGVVLGLIVGLGVTLFSALIPAVRATRIPPMAGLREGATLPRGRFARWSPIIAGLFALAGAALIANGVTGSGAASQLLL